MENQEAKALLEKYRNNLCTEEELAMLESWYNKYELTNISKLTDADWASINATTAPSVKKQVKLWPRIGIAAAVIGLAVGVYFFTAPNHPDNTRHPELVSGSQDIPPGGNKATLAFNNGKTIELKEDKTGVIIGNDLKYNDGTTVISSAARDLLNSKDKAIANITATTKRGGKYEFALSDGTKVWLNNASKLDFPPIFWNPKQRIVKLLTGEAYFEVSKVLSPPGRDGRRPERVPFIVETRGQKIEVLGTHFNISAYDDELSIKTTLVEGSIKVNNVLIKPNQQAVITDGKLKVIEVDAENAIDWKNGDFIFKDEPIEEVMHRLSRWYDIDIVYQGEAPKDGFNGKVSRFKNISQVLKALETTGRVHFKIEGRKVIVTK